VAEQSGSVNIISDDIAQILLSIGTGSITETGATMVTVFTSGDVVNTTGIVVTLVYTGTALRGTDYDTGGNPLTIDLTIPAFATGASYGLTAFNDTLVEGNETVNIQIS